MRVTQVYGGATSTVTHQIPHFGGVVLQTASLRSEGSDATSRLSSVGNFSEEAEAQVGPVTLAEVSESSFVD